MQYAAHCYHYSGQSCSSEDPRTSQRVQIKHLRGFVLAHGQADLEVWSEYLFSYNLAQRYASNLRRTRINLHKPRGNNRNIWQEFDNMETYGVTWCDMVWQMESWFVTGWMAPGSPPAEVTKACKSPKALSLIDFVILVQPQLLQLRLQTASNIFLITRILSASLAFCDTSWVLFILN
jgi:hypothetical protein